MLTPLQAREAFHLAFLRAMLRALPPASFVVKGGSNLRFFFGSVRYSEDMDLDAARAGELPVHLLREKVMSILGSAALSDILKTYGIDRVVPPNLAVAKQTETVQRFKIHLHTVAGEDLATKVEFSRRRLDSPVRTEPVSPEILGAYRMAPVVAPHYATPAAVRQKIEALLGRRQPEARDVFDLFTLRSQPDATPDPARAFTREQAAKARERIYSLTYERYRDTVVAFLSAADQDTYDSRAMWDQIRLVAIEILESGGTGGG